MMLQQWILWLIFDAWVKEKTFLGTLHKHLKDENEIM